MIGKKTSLIVSAIAILSMSASGIEAAEEQADFRDYVIATYETAMTLRSLPKALSNPDYDRLISECRYHLHKSMSSAAASGRWDDMKHRIPNAEVCSYSGKVKAETTREYQNNWRAAENMARRVANSQATAPVNAMAQAQPTQPSQSAEPEALPKTTNGPVQKQPCYVGGPCKATMEKREVNPDGNIAPAAPTQTDQHLTEPSLPAVLSLEELTAKKKDIVNRFGRAEKPFAACEKSMRYPMEVSLISTRLKLSKDELAAYQNKMTVQSLQSCVCVIQKIEPALDNKEAEDYYSFFLENIYTDNN